MHTQSPTEKLEGEFWVFFNRRNTMGKPIYDKNGNLIDWSDEGKEANKILRHTSLQLLLKKLTARQLAVIKLKLKGWHGKEIARKLSISVFTVYNHIKAVKKKLNPPQTN